MKIKESVAIVTGGGRGIGRAIVESLMSHQAKRVIIAEMNDSIGKKTVEELNASHGADRCHFVKCDVSQQEELRQAFKKAIELDGRVDIVCNNAGICNEANPHLVIDVNVKGVINGSLLALEFMSKEKGANGGVVVNVSSAAGLSTVSYMPSYCASKHAIVGWTGSMGSESHLNKHNVRFNCLCPTIIDTSLRSEALLPNSKTTLMTEKDRQDLMRFPPLPMQLVIDQFVKLVEDPKAYNGFAVLIKPPGQVDFLDKSQKTA